MIKVQISHNGKEWNVSETVECGAGIDTNIQHFMLAIKSAQRQANEILSSIVQQEKEVDVTEEEDDECSEEEEEDGPSIECIIGPDKKKIKIE